MLIGVLASPTDKRVGIIPESVKKLSQQGFSVVVESGAGEKAYFPNAFYEEMGASLNSREEVLKQSDILVSVEAPELTELTALGDKKIVVSLFNPLVETEFVSQIQSLPIHAFSLDRIPRTTIAQSMDVLSSMASLAGYKAVLVAANHLPGYFPMLMTAAGTIPPAQVLILGAGVAGLQAIATARRLGARVSAFDVRSAVKEEVQSLGAKFIEVEGAQEDADAGGYAVTQSEAYKKRQQALIHDQAVKSDVVITTAQIPGRTAPILIFKDTVDSMKPGSVIVDLAAISGGNCELTQNDKIIQHKGVTLIGNSNLPGEMSNHASKLFSNNCVNFLSYIFPEGKGELDLENEIVKGTLIS
ncbi:MAG: Re/Si-specific NAD(P)(+) transhydrogenase subunit alpha [Bacteroidota bacterium]